MWSGPCTGCVVEPDLRALLLELADSGVDFVVVGGIAAVLQGVPMATFDLDIVHSRTPENVRNLLQLLERLDACSRLRPQSEKLRPGADALGGSGHQLLSTRLGPLDLLGTVEGGLGFDDLVPLSEPFVVEGRNIRVLSLQALADLKTNATHPKDRFSRLMILETLRLKDDG